MAEHGWFHPDRGYWQTTGYPDDEFVAGYPEGTIEVDVKPGADFVFVDGEWVHQPPAADPAARVAAIKAECRRRIYGMASAETQMNINGVAATISAKPETARTVDDAGFLTAFEASVNWIAAMRAAVATIAADPEADTTADDNWPICPAIVAELAARY